MAETLDGVLVYDGECAFCGAVSSALRRVDDVGAVEWDDEVAQAFLRAQFDDVPFALVVVDRRAGVVRVGRDAARDICDRAGVPALVQDVVGDNYESVADAVRTVVDAEREPDSYHGTFELSEPARERYDALAEAASTMPLSMPER